MKEKCVICAALTPYDESTHIDMRVGYVEGLGQLCYNCYKLGTNRNHILVPENIIIDTPNDMELGGKVRRIYNDQA